MLVIIVRTDDVESWWSPYHDHPVLARYRAVEGNPIKIWPCNGSAAQAWTYGADQTIRTKGMCMRPGGVEVAIRWPIAAFGDNLAAAVASFRPKVNYPIGFGNQVEIMLDDDDRMARINQTLQDFDQTFDAISISGIRDRGEAQRS